MWVLGIEPRSWRAASVLNHWAISQVPWISIYPHSIVTPLGESEEMSHFQRWPCTLHSYHQYLSIPGSTLPCPGCPGWHQAQSPLKRSRQRDPHTKAHNDADAHLLVPWSGWGVKWWSTSIDLWGLFCETCTHTEHPSPTDEGSVILTYIVSVWLGEETRFFEINLLIIFL